MVKGSGSSTIHKGFYNEEGNLVFEKTTDGIINYWQYRAEDGVLEKTIEDADTNGDEFDEQADDCATVPTGFESSGTPDHRVTCLSYEGGPFIPSGGASACACDFAAMGGAVQTDQGPTQVTYRSHLDDGRTATLTFPHWELDVVNGDKYYGPVTYTVTNHAGQVEFQGTIALDPQQHDGEHTTVSPSNFIDETKSDPLPAISGIGGIGSVAQLTTAVFSETGLRVNESRVYFKIPTSGTGDATNNYDPTLYSYDDMGRLVRVKDPTGTIERMAFDERGRVTGRSIGTDDQDEAGTDNMVQTVAIEYDGGDDGGNDLVTEQTLYVQDGSMGERVTTFINDFRGRTIVTVGPEPPFAVNMYDNQDRSVAMGLYSSSSGLDEDTDPTATSSSNRVALDETAYDELGRVFKTVRWKINESTGAKDDSLESLTWYDAAGRVIKLDGEQLVKIAYDRLGRQTHEFILAVAEDSMGLVETAYADADDTDYDIVLEERQTVYDANTGDVLMTVVIDRDHDDYGAGETTGPLDANADGGTPDPLKLTAADLSGRAQITAHWYDNLGRTVATARYGNYGGATFDRADSGFGDPPDQSADDENELVTTYVYYTDGRLKEVKDPEGQRTRYEYDAAGRTTAEIRNYVDGTPSGANGDDDVHSRRTWARGLLETLWVDLDGDGTVDTGDPVTQYAYEVTPSDSPGPSKIDADRLLRQVTYPDSGIVRFAYNAQSERIWNRDQGGNEIAVDRDDIGRPTARRATVATGFDDRVQRIETAYDSVGRVWKVTQYDATTGGNATDEVVYGYDGWSNVTKIEQDSNSTVGYSGSVDDYEVSFSYAKATTGRNTIRRSGMTLPDSNGITYQFMSADGRHDDDASRVTQFKYRTLVVAKYDYLGVSHLVGTRYPAPDVRSQRHSGGGYADLDRFNRVAADRWTKILTTNVDYYDQDVAYDRSSNITVVDEHVHSGFDTAFELDGLHRLQTAEQGTWSGSAITSTTRQQLWENPSAVLALDQLGNWDHVRLDLDGNGSFTGTGEYDDDRTHNPANELTTQDVEDDSTTDYTLSYDGPGNLIDDGRAYEYVWDAFGRLVAIRDTDDQALIAEHHYNGLGHRIGWHYDVDADSSLEDEAGGDPWYWFVYDDQWRVVATYRHDDASPKERYVHHAAGLGGYGGSSYIDAIVFRDRDADTAWNAQSDGTLDERVYYCRNWRGDVVALVDDAGDPIEQVRYSSYGVPLGLPAGDTDSDGDVDSTDVAQIDTWYTFAIYDVRGDLDLDGDVDLTDKSIAQGYVSTNLGWGVLSGDAANRRGYAGYDFDSALEATFSIYHVRHRVLNSDLGRWLSRDPVGYDAGLNLYEYVNSNPVRAVDPMGTFPPGPEGGTGRRPIPTPRPPPGTPGPCFNTKLSDGSGSGGAGCGCGGGGTGAPFGTPPWGPVADQSSPVVNTDASGYSTRGAGVSSDTSAPGPGAAASTRDDAIRHLCRTTVCRGLQGAECAGCMAGSHRVAAGWTLAVPNATTAKEREAG